VTAPMPRTRRRIVRRAVMAMAVVALLLIVMATREPPEIRRSRALRLGMTRAEVEAVMGKQDGAWGVSKPLPGEAMAGGGSGGGTPNGVYFGRSIAPKLRVLRWIGIPRNARHDDWPVRVRFDNHGNVDLIQRAREPAEQAP
jgi:hypothetical protein